MMVIINYVELSDYIECIVSPPNIAASHQVLLLLYHVLKLAIHEYAKCQ